MSHDILVIQMSLIFWRWNSSCLCASKNNNFIVGISNFGIVYFKCYIFILCGKMFHVISTLIIFLFIVILKKDIIRSVWIRMKCLFVSWTSNIWRSGMDITLPFITSLSRPRTEHYAPCISCFGSQTHSNKNCSFWNVKLLTMVIV